MSDMPDSFGDVTSEYLALHNGAGLIQGRIALTWVEGADTIAFLDGLLSQAVEPLHDGGAARSLLLSPQGKLRAPVWILRRGDSVGVISEARRQDVVISDLSRFKIRVDVAISPGDPVVELWGAAAEATLAGVAATIPGANAWVATDTGLIASLPLARSGHPRFVTTGISPSTLTAGGAIAAGRLAVDAVRIELGEPEMGVDLDEGTIPQEGDVVAGAVSFDKGCYLGQELVARIDSRGHVNRHLRGLVIGENVLPPLGAELVAGDKIVGSLTSLGESLQLRAPIGLALVRREVAPGDHVTVRWAGGATPAQVRELPLVGAE